MDLTHAGACLGAAFAIGLAGLGYGTLAPRDPERPCSIEAPWALGLGLLSGIVLALGLLSLLSRTTVVLAVAAGIALLVPARQRRRLASDRRPAKATVATLAFLVPSLFASIVPPTFFDVLMYNLSLPEVYLREGAISVRHETILSFYPQATEMLYLAALALTRLPEAAAGIHVVIASLATLATGTVAARISGATAAPRAALLFVTAPAVLILATLAKNDLAGVLFFAIALDGALDLLDGGPPPRCAALALGLAMGCKYTAVYTAVALVVPLSVALALRRARPSLRALLLLAALIALPALPWYVRSAVTTGNPFYPALSRVFGTAPFQRAGFLNPAERRTLPVSQLLELPLHVSFGWSGLGLFNEIGPLFLGLGIAAMALRVPARHAWFLAGYAALDLLFWWRTFTLARFLFPLLPIAAAIGAAGWARLSDRLGPRRILDAAVALAVLSNLASFARDARHLLDPLPYLLGRESRDAYLARVYPPYEALHSAGRLLPAGARVLFVGETRGLYMERPYVASSTNDRTPIVEYVKASRDLPDLLRRIATDGFTHVLYNPVELERIERDYGPYLYFDTDRERDLYRAFVAAILAHPVFERRGVSLLLLPATA
ncbi:MAG: hypothetical protein U0166_05420 [Acidobacteriota bacterium]